jgi:hypothetical protein
MIIASDFDGTIVDHLFPDLVEPVPGAFKWLKVFQERGAKLILWTMRSGETLHEAVDYCRDNGIEFWGVNVNPGQKRWTVSPKAYAQLYIDDAAFGCPLLENPRAGGRPFVNWDQVGPAVAAQLDAHALDRLRKRAA